MKKVVIIGSGLGGLSTGVVLAKNGYDVTVLEQGNQIGGCLQCFYRHGVKFETGMHFVGSADEGQILNKMLRYLEIDDKLLLSRLDVDCYNVDMVRIGANAIVSQGAYLCTASHDITNPQIPLITAPIIIEDQAWVAADAFVGMGVTVGQGAVVGARAVVFKDVEPWTVVGGNPAKFIKKRILKD